MKKLPVIFTSFILSISTSYAAEVIAKIYTTDGSHQLLGQVVFKDTEYGLLISPDLKDLPPGPHGLHLHQHPDCGDKGMEAGGHFDPQKTGTHRGPYGQGHLGDLPVLYVNKNGTANTITLAPRLKTSNLQNMSVMIHAGGDNYSDNPELGGGGARIACGVINKD
ncbi:superoxide dismutase family protein [Legionella oakridgensis]|uniref:Superoxide dismutase [Cu-Zn] n=2 Tax=Legionella oakridgensis TaxID=29423 RepID=W0BCM8_9GAMM|nr:superoxide dismutase family protein [Legionella oakridgensis]AHE66372.1 Cu/Zn superoxide dismutase [Legionella oakridgensis ATCC 33761 = DSM 21215]ETO93878.1 Cu/Zn superoxide dismutase [Legionella oakridgensis RV-2-2007]KTD44013.1 superoxide dismutase, Cu, Zn [Legionella oakridgensis]STY19556.1 superoxide dismutase, Cu, Zn [Legionella longbeachae]